MYACATLNDEILETARRVDAARPGFPLVLFGSLDDEKLRVSGYEPEEMVDDLKSRGFGGVKLWEGKPHLVRRLSMLPDDRRFVLLCRRAAQLSMPVIFHIADPPAFWKNGGPYASDDSLPGFSDLIEAASRLASLAPQCTFIFPHMLFLAGDLGVAARFLDEHPSCYFDLAPGNYLFADLALRREEAAAFFARYSKRIVFGTDGFWFDPGDKTLAGDSYGGNLLRFTRLLDFLSTDRQFDNPFGFSVEAHPRITGLKLPESILRPILSENAKVIMEAL